MSKRKMHTVKTARYQLEDEEWEEEIAEYTAASSYDPAPKLQEKKPSLLKELGLEEYKPEWGVFYNESDGLAFVDKTSTTKEENGYKLVYSTTDEDFAYQYLDDLLGQWWKSIEDKND